MNQNGTIWSDTQGNLIQAHGGMILKFKDRYYWYGENKNGPTFTESPGGLSGFLLLLLLGLYELEKRRTGVKQQ